MELVPQGPPSGDLDTGARIIAVANQKGGVGKSTTVVNLGAWLALRGSRVLLVDLDPQANATTGVGIDSRTVSGNVYRMLVDDLPVDDAIEATSVRNLYVVPSTIDLAGAEIELVATFSRELRLKKALEPARADFDFIFIDCPPSLGLLTVNALAAAKEVMVPIQCEFYALEGLGQLLKNVSLVQSSLNPDLRLSGIVLTMFDARTKLAEQVATEVRSHFPGRVHSSVIPRSVRLSEAPSFGQPVALYDPKSQGSLAYEKLAAEVEDAGNAGRGQERAEDSAGPPSPEEQEGSIRSISSADESGSPPPEADFSDDGEAGPVEHGPPAAVAESPDAQDQPTEDDLPAPLTSRLEASGQDGPRGLVPPATSGGTTNGTGTEQDKSKPPLEPEHDRETFMPDRPQGGSM